MRRFIDSADETSSRIDSLLVNTQLDFEPRFDVNDSFDDIYPNLG